MTIAIAALLAVVVAAVLSRRTGVATPLVLLVIGIVVSLTPWGPEFELDPEWILAGVLPPLLYASAVRVPVIDLRRNFAMIGWLSVTLVIVSALVIGAVVHWLVPEIPFAAGVALGAVISPTDAVAATSIGKRLGLPPRLMTVLEGESLLNDASALVLLRTAVVAVTAASFSLGDAVWEFARAVVIAVVIGLLVGHATVRFRARLADPVLTTATSFIVPFLAFLPAEHFEASGVVAVVVAGLVTGHEGARRFSARERSTEHTNWNTLQFLLENGVFLLMGLELRTLVDELNDSADRWETALLLVGVAVVVLLVLRTVFVAVQVIVERRRRPRRAERRERIDTLADRIENLPVEDARVQRRVSMFRRRIARGRADLDFFEREPLTARGGVVIAWAGMRGVVTLAAALSISTVVEQRTLLVTVAFGVAVVSLLLYGGTLPLVIRWLKVPMADPGEVRDELRELMHDLSDAASAEVGAPEELVVDGQAIDPEVVAEAKERARQLREARTEPRTPGSLTRNQQLALVRRVYLDAMREALHEERAIGAYSTAALTRAEQLLDAEELRLDR
ncbi:MAG TPA: sodium:proton antiporter [Actinotalea caeni]|uniref:cation:proton antiporter n=1 Tax=Actinotalea caeni TaxID=1348467 RepID=UPI0012E14994|nr:sodium:proton antiporter [Actinotalea caeni]HLV54698.1 sodium:proton antiporter [Actinotalea caeni]